MTRLAANYPVVLCFSGHDPVGGAGIQADIEAITRFDCHPCTIITALTVQDSCNVRAIYPQNAHQLLAQAQCAIADMPPQVVKIGLLGNAEIAAAVADLLEQMPDIPVVLDPVLAAGGGYDLSGTDLLDTLVNRLLPRTTLLTPNTQEAARLSGMSGESLDCGKCAERLMTTGCRHVLITGTHAASADVVNRLYSRSESKAHTCYREWHWPRLPHSYHGSGCTLAAALAAALATGLSMEEAAERAQQYTWQTLANGYRPGRGQYLPRRR